MSMWGSSRRKFLSSVGLGAGATLLTPLVDRILPDALGAVQPARRRFILMTHGGGLLEDNYTCPARSDTDFDLTPVLSPLAPYKKDLIVASKFYCPHDKKLHGNQFAGLSMMPSSNQNYDDFNGFPPGGTSIDRFLAKQMGTQDPISGTVVAIDENGNDAVNLSADGKDQPFPAMGSPVKAYETFFGKGIPDKGQDAQALLARNRSLLDFVRGDIGRLNRRLAPSERAKLDQYLESLRGVERQLTTLGNAQVACMAPTKPALDRANLDPQIISAHIAVTFAAQMCGITRVSHLSWHGFGSPHVPYGWLGDTKGFHNQNHDNDRVMIDKISRYIVSTVAEMAALLTGTSEGSGTMLDNTLLVFMNTCGGKHHDGHDTYSVITLGRAGSALKTGRSVSYAQGEHSLGDVWLAVANLMGVQADTFGDPKYCRGPLPALVP